MLVARPEEKIAKYIAHHSHEAFVLEHARSAEELRTLGANKLKLENRLLINFLLKSTFGRHALRNKHLGHELRLFAANRIDEIPFAKKKELHRILAPALPELGFALFVTPAAISPRIPDEKISLFVHRLKTALTHIKMRHDALKPGE